MTESIDKLMIKAGFDAAQVNKVKFRPALYAGNISLLFLSGLFLSLIVL